jgi:hypothetical protein
VTIRATASFSVQFRSRALGSPARNKHCRQRC